MLPRINFETCQKMAGLLFYIIFFSEASSRCWSRNRILHAEDYSCCQAVPELHHAFLVI